MIWVPALVVLPCCGYVPTDPSPSKKPAAQMRSVFVGRIVGRFGRLTVWSPFGIVFVPYPVFTVDCSTYRARCTFPGVGRRQLIPLSHPVQRWHLLPLHNRLPPRQLILPVPLPS